MSERETRLELQERERLLYVAMTRAREYCLLAMDAPVRSVNKQPVLDLRDDIDLTGRVLEQILPAGSALNGGMLCFEDSRRGDFELLALQDFACGDAAYTQNYSVEDGCFIGEDAAAVDAAAADTAAAAGTAAVVAADAGDAAAAGSPPAIPWRTTVRRRIRSRWWLPPPARGERAWPRAPRVNPTATRP